MTMRGGALLLFGTGIGGGSIPRRERQTSRDRSTTFQRRPAAPHLAARRPPRPGGLRLGRLARRGGPAWWQMLPLGPPDRHRSPYKAASAFAAWPGLLGEPDAPVSKAEELDFREREHAWIEDWARFGPRGAVADQVRFDREWAALRAYAAERGVKIIGDVPIYVAPRSADHRAHPELFQERRRRGHAARRLHRQGPAVGQPALRLAGDAAPRLPLVDRAARAHLRALRPRAHRPLPRLRRLLGGAGGREARAQRVVEARAGAGGVRARGARRWTASCR